MSKKSEDTQTYLIVKSCVLQNAELSPLDKLVLSQIDYLDKIGEERGCWMSNSNIGKFLGVSASYVSCVVQKLETMGLVSYKKEGRKRILLSNIDSHSISISGKKDIECQSIQKDSHTESIQKDIECQSISTEMLENRLTKPEEQIRNVIPKTIKDYTKDKNKSINNNTVPLDKKSQKVFDKLAKAKQNNIITIFEFWNTYKKSGKWKKHTKLTSEMIEVILENMKKYSLNDICLAIDNYAKVLQSDEYYWTHVWPLSIFLSVKIGPAKDAYKKWWKFLPENFVAESYLKRELSQNERSNNRRASEPLPDDPDPQFTKFIIQAWKQRIPMMDKEAFPNHNQMKHFINFTIKVTAKYDIPDDRIRNSMAKELIDILIHYKTDEAWRVKGGVLKPWMLASDHFWNEYFPQWYRNAGLPLECLTHFRNENVFKEMKAEEEQLTEDIEKNIKKHNPKPKVISDDDCPELDYMKNA
jgi:hypothetical protein